MEVKINELRSELEYIHSIQFAIQNSLSDLHYLIKVSKNPSLYVDLHDYIYSALKEVNWYFSNISRND